MTRDDFNKFLLLVAIFMGALIAMVAINKRPSSPPVPPVQRPQEPPTLPKPKTPNISVKTPPYKDYGGVVRQLHRWEAEAEDLAQVGTYGKTSRGLQIYYIRLTNEHKAVKKPTVLITASIHGDEPWSTGCVMAYIGNMLASYGQDDEITDFLDNRTIFFVPVVSPDSYPNSRYVDGVDPNRNFPSRRNPNKRSVPPVQALMEFFLLIEANAVISGHTHGRLYLHPWGDSHQQSPNHSEFEDIVGEMGRLSRYRVIQAVQMYNRPIYGAELDWFYSRGAFAIVMEFGTHQKKPSYEQIKREFNRTYKAVCLFIKKAPLVKINHMPLRMAS